MFHVSCLTFSVSCQLFSVSCLFNVSRRSYVSYIMFPVSLFLSNISCLTTPMSSLLSHAFCLPYPVSRDQQYAPTMLNYSILFLRHCHRAIFFLRATATCATSFSLRQWRGCVKSGTSAQHWLTLYLSVVDDPPFWIASDTVMFGIAKICSFGCSFGQCKDIITHYRFYIIFSVFLGLELVGGLPTFCI